MTTFFFGLLFASNLLSTAAYAGGDVDNSAETEFYEPEATDDARYHVPPSPADIEAAAATSAPTASADEPASQSYSPDENIRSLDENAWNETHSEEGVCREASGDVICFESGSAENVGW
ncbi:MAG: hypothetical protein AAF810_11830 [Cyanobacteria bacterium P01_D01_bin.36]